MVTKSDVAPSTLSVSLEEGGVAVEYLDGREVFYRGVPERVEGRLRTPPGKEVHVLVTDPEGTRGVLLYVDDRRTADAILEDTGVGRVMLADGEREEAFPGVAVERDGHHHVVDADPEVVDGRVFVFVEDEFEERSYEVVVDGDGDGRVSTDGEATDGESTDGEATDGEPANGAAAGERPDGAAEGGD